MTTPEQPKPADERTAEEWIEYYKDFLARNPHLREMAPFEEDNEN